jgi:glycerate-2-kinase
VIGRLPWDPFPPGTPDPKGPDPLQALVFRSAVTGADAYRSVRFALKRENGVLRIGNRFVADARYREVAFVAAGNAANSMALATLAVLDERVTQGYLAGPEPVVDEVPFQGVELPPGWGGAERAAEVVRAAEEIAERLGESDLLILLLSPGAIRAFGTPPPGMTSAEFARFLEMAHARGASGREVGLLSRTLGSTGVGGSLLPPTVRADVETLVVERGDGAAFVGGGPTIAVRPAERAEARAVLVRLGVLDALPAPAREWLSPGAAPFALPPATARRPVVVSGPPDAVRAAADTTFDKGWTARLAALELREPPAAAADRFLELVDGIVRGESPGSERRSKGLAAFAMLTLDLPEGSEEGPGMVEFLERARSGLRRREMSLGLFRTSGSIGDPAYPAGGVVGTPSDPEESTDRSAIRALLMQPGITDVGLLVAAVLPRALAPSAGP